ncbi:hypothetical protein FRC19_006083 [Serendipita sp. 401]|nr:hypothetical protein FRC19_006083 [Serendipita sp. 401]
MPPRAPPKPRDASSHSTNPPATRGTAVPSRVSKPSERRGRGGKAVSATARGGASSSRGPSFLARVQQSPLEAAGISKTRKKVQELRDETAALAASLEGATIMEVPEEDASQPATRVPGTLVSTSEVAETSRGAISSTRHGQPSGPASAVAPVQDDDAMSVEIDDEIGRASPVALPEDFFSESLVAGISATVKADAGKVTRMVQVPHGILEDSSTKVLLESAQWMKRFEECKSHGDILRAVPDKYVESLKEIVSGFWKDTRAHAAAKTALIRVKQHQRKGTFPSMFNAVGVPALQFSSEYTAEGMTTFSGDVSDSIKALKQSLLSSYLKEKVAEAAFYAEKCKVTVKAKELEGIILGRMKTLVARYPPREECTAELKRVIDNLTFNGCVLAHCSTIILARIVQINESHEEEKLADTLEKMEIGQQATALAQSTPTDKAPSADVVVKKMIVELDKRGLLPNKKSPGKKTQNSRPNAANSSSKKQQKAKGGKNDGKSTGLLQPLGKKAKAQQAKAKQQQQSKKKGKNPPSARR